MVDSIDCYKTSWLFCIICCSVSGNRRRPRCIKPRLATLAADNPWAGGREVAGKGYYFKLVWSASNGLGSVLLLMMPDDLRCNSLLLSLSFFFLSFKKSTLLFYRSREDSSVFGSCSEDLPPLKSLSSPSIVICLWRFSSKSLETALATSFLLLLGLIRSVINDFSWS